MVIDDEFDDLKREFLAEAADKIREIREICERSFPPGAADGERITYLAHQLKGAGGSYGFPQISNDAAGLETEIEAAMTGDDSVEQSVRDRIARMWDSVGRQLETLG